jgi:hypothetical protein
MSTDVEAPRRALVERAFLHLDRSIVVDDRLRDTWQRALENGGETECEKLGAVHLLLHGIWAFKVNAAGERTDLVLQEPLDLTDEIDAAARAFILTEWKVAQSVAEAEQRAGEARAQTRRYSKGSLAATEIQSTRYIVVVSDDRLVVPRDVLEDGVTFRHVNIAVNPSPPSATARAEERARRGRG